MIQEEGSCSLTIVCQGTVIQHIVCKPLDFHFNGRDLKKNCHVPLFFPAEQVIFRAYFSAEWWNDETPLITSADIIRGTISFNISGNWTRFLGTNTDWRKRKREQVIWKRLTTIFDSPSSFLAIQPYICIKVRVLASFLPVFQF